MQSIKHHRKMSNKTRITFHLPLLSGVLDARHLLPSTCFCCQVCWTQDTYYLPMNVQNIPKTARGKEYISYYQWVALVLVCQACLFYMPRSLWRMLNKKSGIAICTVTGEFWHRHLHSDRWVLTSSSAQWQVSSDIVICTVTAEVNPRPNFKGVKCLC